MTPDKTLENSMILTGNSLMENTLKSDQAFKTKLSQPFLSMEEDSY